MTSWFLRQRLLHYLYKRISRRWLCLILVWLSGWFGSVSGIPPEQIQQMIHRRWEDPTLSSILNITSFAQTADGYLWIGTREGLVRFDGIRFKYYKKNDTPGLFNDDFQTLLLAKDQTLYCGVFEAGLVRVKDNIFRSFIREDGLSNRRVAALAEGKDGTIYIGTRAGGIFLLRDEVITPLNIPGQGFFDVRSICLVNGEIWMGSGSEQDIPAERRRAALGDRSKSPRTGGVIGHWDGKNYHRIQLPGADLTTEVCAIILGPDGMLYIATSNQGVYSMPPNSSGPINRIPEPPSGLQRARGLAFDSLGALWVTLGTGMVARCERGIWSTFPLIDGVRFHAAEAIFQDKEGTVWVGTTSGLDCFYSGAVTTFGKPEGLAGDETTCVTEDELGQIWVGSSDRHLSMISSNGISNFNLGPERGGTIQSLAPAKGGGVWFGRTNGLAKMKDGLLHFYTSKDGLPEDWVWSIYEDNQTNVWIGSPPGVGLHSFKPGSKGTNYAGTRHLGIRTIVPDGEGGLWLGTQNHGLVNFRNGVIRRSWSKTEGLSDDSVRSLLVDSNNTVWVGTRDRGLNRFSNGPIDRFRWQQGFGADQVSGIVRDDLNQLWMGTPRGIFRASISGLDRLITGNALFSDFRLFTQVDGMRSEECRRENNPSVLRSRDGLLWFTTRMGLSMVDPKRVHTEEGPLPVQIETLEVGGIVKSSSESLVFAAGDDNVRITFTATALRYPSRVRFRYKLSGVDPDWVMLPSSLREVSYRNLKPASYKFSVQAVSGAAEFNGTPKVVAFILPPLFYQTKTFYGLFVGCALALMFLLHLFRLRMLARRAFTLQAEVFARTSELRAEIIERERGEAQLRLLPARILQAQEGERRRVASELHDSVTQLLASVRVRVHHLETLLVNEPLVHSAILKTKELLDHSVQEVRRISRNLRPVELDDFGLKVALENSCDEFRLRTRLNLDLVFNERLVQIPSRLELPIYRIIQEALTNIERHADARTVRVELTVQASSLLLTVRDDGKGFSSGNHQHLHPRKQGIGLINIRERAVAVGGICSIQSVEGHGTEITVQFSQ